MDRCPHRYWVWYHQDSLEAVNPDARGGRDDMICTYNFDPYESNKVLLLRQLLCDCFVDQLAGLWCLGVFFVSLSIAGGHLFLVVWCEVYIFFASRLLRFSGIAGNFLLNILLFFCFFSKLDLCASLPQRERHLEESDKI